MADTFDAIERGEQRSVADATAMDWRQALETSKPEKRSFFSRFRRSKKEDESAEYEALAAGKRRISLKEPYSYATEQFRTLRGRIDYLSMQQSIKSVAITSANAGEGKSLSSINLSIVSAMSVGQRVLLVDCDLRRPTIHTALELDPKAGLGEVLQGEATFDEAVLSFEESSLDVLCVCGQPDNPSELLASPRMCALIEEFADRYDRVVFDTPVTLGLPDSKIICDLADGVVFVVRAGVTTQEDVETCLDLLDRRRVLGVVLNGTEKNSKPYGYS